MTYATKNRSRNSSKGKGGYKKGDKKTSQWEQVASELSPRSKDSYISVQASVVDEEFNTLSLTVWDRETKERIAGITLPAYFGAILADRILSVLDEADFEVADPDDEE